MCHDKSKGRDGIMAYPTIDEKEWYALAVAAASITVVVAFFILLWVLYGRFPEDRAERISIAGAIVTFCVAVTTFCSVAWRGLIATRQIAETRRQIEVTEENNLAETLQKGAELISENSRAKAAAGIASLHSVMIASNARLATAAQSLMLEYVIHHGSDGHGLVNVTRAAKALTSAYLTTKKPLIESAYFVIDSDRWEYDDEYTTDWIVIYGVSEVEYSGGNVNKQVILPVKEVKFTRVTFNECTFEDLSNVNFSRCNFYDCKIGRIHTSLLANNHFTGCEFAGTTIVFDQAMPDMREGRNFTYTYDQPKASGNTGKAVVWKNVFNEFDEPVDQSVDDS